MNFLPENPKTRQLVIIIAGVAAALFAFGFLYITYFSSPGSGDGGSGSVASNPKLKAITEEVIKRLKKDVANVQDELDNDFYKNLKSYSWPQDTTVAGNPNPFLIPDGK